eukprot:UN01031
MKMHTKRAREKTISILVTDGFRADLHVAKCGVMYHLATYMYRPSNQDIASFQTVDSQTLDDVLQCSFAKS